mgnify:CR=1 FL=1
MKRRGKLLKQILQAAALGTATLDPESGHNRGITTFARWYKSQDRRIRFRIRRIFIALRREHIIELQETGGETKIALTPAGDDLLRQYKLEEIIIPRPKRWDKKWRLVMFDIPEHLKKSRTIFRNKLVAAGFRQLQKSAWLYPYECREEIEALAKFLEIAPYVIYLKISAFDREEEFQKNFKL